MQIKKVTKAEASIMLEKHGLAVALWSTCRISNNRYQAIICDYTSQPGYDRVYSVALYSDSGTMLGRFNVIG